MLRLAVLNTETILQTTTDTREGEGGGRPAEASKVPEGDYKNTALTAAAILSGISKEVADESSPLGPLKAVLRTTAAIYGCHQETVGVKKIEHLLSRVVSLEERFYSRPDGVEEQRRRRELIRYVAIPPSGSMLSYFQRVRSHRRTTTVSV
ncbi:hypothetical protein BDM02DRAFT_877116 [Thelephora ganbajun]|uniref:Uncharacterized protein n=1 Tax=Thelephora ganbajun TaxID=370292 RepID=A0ACB6Z5Q4_THEGA|nr:hypothetical protein BDM02DRAFT_877116 [Thelephora ganbajun]